MLNILQKMTRTILTALLTLLLTLSATAQNATRRGPGCWRTPTSQKKAAARLATPRKASATTNYLGKKKGLVILCEFTDKQFQAANDREKYNNILNTRGYTSEEGFKGSVADYFLDQSGGLFELDFDVVGPYTTKNGYAYYGKNSSQGDDMRAEDMVVEMCKAADADVNFADYDWDDDGEVDEVFVVYAWKGEADSGLSNTIWPHMWSLDEAMKFLTLDGKKINVYACANEIESNGSICGIGTFCHEFSHCLGFADFYDVSYSGLFGMGDFDVMDAGLYGNGGFCPVGYSAFEKMSCGWQQPIVLSGEDVSVDSLKPMNLQGDFYIIYNDAHPDEYYLIENRQKKGWDKYLPAKGLMITHVDYDEEVWYNNIPNTIMTEKEAKRDGYTCGNDHQRVTIFHADNDDDSKYWSSTGGYYNKKTVSTDLYPYQKNDSLTATSQPAATLFNDNPQGTKLAMGSILDIRQNTGSEGTMSFRYRALNPTIIAGIAPRSPFLVPPTSNVIHTLDGRSVGTSLESLPHGIYIVGGRKVVK